jgi:S1-C subfamily serine protease
MSWLAATVLAEPPIDLPNIARGSSPAVLRLVIYDDSGNEHATATGFFVSDDGQIVTNRHVLESADSQGTSRDRSAPKRGRKDLRSPTCEGDL